MLALRNPQNTTHVMKFSIERSDQWKAESSVHQCKTLGKDVIMRDEILSILGERLQSLSCPQMARILLIGQRKECGGIYEDHFRKSSARYLS